MVSLTLKKNVTMVRMATIPMAVSMTVQNYNQAIVAMENLTLSCLLPVVLLFILIGRIAC
jgi:hypothetical protein